MAFGLVELRIILLPDRSRAPHSAFTDLSYLHVLCMWCLTNRERQSSTPFWAEQGGRTTKWNSVGLFLLHSHIHWLARESISLASAPTDHGTNHDTKCRTSRISPSPARLWRLTRAVASSPQYIRPPHTARQVFWSNDRGFHWTEPSCGWQACHAWWSGSDQATRFTGSTDCRTSRIGAEFVLEEGGEMQARTPRSFWTQHGVAGAHALLMREEEEVVAGT